MRLTKPQAQTLRRKWIDGQHEHGSTRGVSYLSFRRTVEPTFDDGYAGNAVMVRWCGMYIGIEADGYPHS